MIDHSSDCPRPHPDDPKANDWQRTSRFIKSWLVASISSQIHFEVKLHTGGEPEYADTMWQGLKVATRNDGIYGDCKVVHKFLSLEPKNFPTLNAYLDAYHKGLEDMEKIEINPDMKYVILTLLNNAEYFRVNNDAVKIIKRRLHEENKGPKDYDKMLCFDVTRELRYQRKLPKSLQR